MKVSNYLTLNHGSHAGLLPAGRTRLYAPSAGLLKLATSAGTSSVPVSAVTGITGASAVTNIVSLSQANYDAIDTPDASTLYVITE